MPKSLKSHFALLLVKPDGTEFEKDIRDYLQKQDFLLVYPTPVRRRLNYEEAEQIYIGFTKNLNWNSKVYLSYLTSMDSIVMLLEYPHKKAQTSLKELVGDMNPEEANKRTLRHMLKEKIRNRFGTLEIDGSYLNGVHAADTAERAAEEAIILLGEKDARIFVTE
ncbi:MAG TPA: nucleoside-diphosphate kinase [archaeon]|nr:nucleoside-diphosphate kinase [archaeon]